MMSNVRARPIPAATTRNGRGNGTCVPNSMPRVVVTLADASPIPEVLPVTKINSLPPEDHTGKWLLLRSPCGSGASWPLIPVGGNGSTNRLVYGTGRPVAYAIHRPSGENTELGQLGKCSRSGRCFAAFVAI